MTPLTPKYSAHSKTEMLLIVLAHSKEEAIEKVAFELKYSPDRLAAWKANHQDTRLFLSISDLIDQYPSYLDDMENCMEPAELKAYRKDRVPYIEDLIANYGDFAKYGITSNDEILALAHTAAVTYCRR